MTRLRLVFACVMLAAFAPLALANPAPPPDWKDTGSRRDGPLRSCGSGMGLGLAAIGAAWGFMWVGHRVAGRVSRRNEAPKA